MDARPALRIAVVGTGAMGADHVRRLHHRISGAEVAVVSDVDTGRARRLAAEIPGCRAVDDPVAAIDADGVDAVVVASPGHTHEQLVLACLRREVPVLCEKPLTMTAVSARRIVDAEAKLGRRLVQVGFMRRFDREYVELRRLVDAGDLGRPLLVHHRHRNMSVPAHVDTATVLTDSVGHEIDITRFLLGEEIHAVTVIAPRATGRTRPGLHDPQIVLLETASGVVVDVEIFVNFPVGYEVTCEVVGELGSATAGLDHGVVRRTGGRWGGAVPETYLQRFDGAYQSELQYFVDNARLGTVSGPGSGDGYAAVAVSEAAVSSSRTGARTLVDPPPP